MGSKFFVLLQLNTEKSVLRIKITTVVAWKPAPVELDEFEEVIKIFWQVMETYNLVFMVSNGQTKTAQGSS